MKLIKYGMAAVSFLVALSPAAAFAGGTQSGLVAQLDFRSGDVGTPNDSLVVVTLSASSPKTSSPACATLPYWFIRDAKSEIGKQQIALLMTAKVLGRSVTILGTGACARWGDGEDILQITWYQ